VGIVRTLAGALAGSSWELVRGASEKDLRDFARLVAPVVTQRGLIRLGPAGDGGYLVADDLEGIQACFSPGVSEIAGFELDLAKRGIPCFLAGHSVEAPPVAHDLFHFEKKFLGTREDDMFTTLDSWVARHAPGESDLILQMDIEGAEYAVLHSVSEALLRRFRIIVIEFHDFDKIHSQHGLELMRLVFEKLMRFFDVVHIHPNNCGKSTRRGAFETPRLLEFTFLRKDRVTMREPARQFPHRLDGANVPGRADIVLPACWQA